MPAVPIIAAGASIAGGLLNKKKGKGSTSQESGKQSEQYQFDPTAFSEYQGLQPQVAKTFSDFMARPWESGFFQNALTQTSEATGQRANVMRSNLLNPALMAQGSVSNPSAFLLSQNNAIGRNASRERADSLTNLLLGSANLRFNAAQQAGAYRPLQIGATSNYTKGGSTNESSGSWPGNLLGAAGGILGGLPNRSPSPSNIPGYAGGIMAAYPNTASLFPPITAPGYNPYGPR